MRDTIRPFVAVLSLGYLAAFATAVSGSSALAQAGQMAPPAGQQAQAVKQIALTPKQVDGVLAAQKEMEAITAGIPENANANPDPKVQAQVDAVAKKYGFSGAAEYGDVVDNISLVLSGVDPQTKTFMQPPEALKKQIAMIQSDTKMPAKDKKEALDEMNAALKTTPTVQFPANIALVTKNYDKLSAALQNEQQK